jgi:hemerythrin-like metal-binding protein
MEKISWKSEYSLGIEKVDRQHQHMFEIINKIIGCCGPSGDTNLVADTIEEMVNYAREHFADEEMLMRQYGYPNLDAHKKEHNYFIDTTAELAVGFMNNKNTTGGEIAEFLSIWLTNHILKTDMKYKELLKAKMPPAIQSAVK